MSDQLVAEAATCTIRDKHSSRISMPAAEFEPAIKAISALQNTQRDDLVIANCLYCFLFYGATAQLDPRTPHC